MIRKWGFQFVALIMLSMSEPVAAWAQNDATVVNKAIAVSDKALNSEVTHLTEINVKPGLNTVYFAGIDQQGNIFVTTKHGDDESSHEIFLIATNDPDGGSDWAIVPMGVDEDKTIEDERDDGFYFRSVRFMNGSLRGDPITLLFISTLNGAISNINGPTATIVVEKLVQPGDPGAIDDTSIEFLPILQFKTKGKYRDADEALLHELNIPLPPGFQLGG
jgi:hypothetical protein